MVVNPVRNPGRTLLEVSADSGRNRADSLYPITRRGSDHFIGGLISRGVKRPKFAVSVTLVEVMTAILILVIAVLGASGYRYYAALDARKAALHSTAARTTLLLCEGWRGQGFEGAASYDPIAHLGSELPISAGSGPAAPDDFTVLGSYTVVLNDSTYYATLSWKDVSLELRALNVVVAWSQRGEGASIADADKLFKLTTYTSK